MIRLGPRVVNYFLVILFYLLPVISTHSNSVPDLDTFRETATPERVSSQGRDGTSPLTLSPKCPLAPGGTNSQSCRGSRGLYILDTDGRDKAHPTHENEDPTTTGVEQIKRKKRPTVSSMNLLWWVGTPHPTTLERTTTVVCLFVKGEG